jgi:hypothetical protein
MRPPGLACRLWNGGDGLCDWMIARVGMQYRPSHDDHPDREYRERDVGVTTPLKGNGPVLKKAIVISGVVMNAIAHGERRLGQLLTR